MSILDDVLASLRPPDEERPVLDRIMVPERLILPLLTRYAVIERMRRGERPDTHEAKTCNHRLAWADLWGWLEEVIPATKGKACQLNFDQATRPEIEVVGPMPDLPEGAVEITGAQRQEIRILIERVDEDPTALNRYLLWHRLEEMYPEITEGSHQLAILPTGLFVAPRKENDEEECQCKACRSRRD